MDRRWFVRGAVAFCLLAASGPALADGLRIGVARVDITPDYPIRLHGYMVRSEETKAVQQRIGAKALAIRPEGDGAEASLLITVDNLGVSDAIVSEVAARLKRKAGQARERLAVASSHTHSAPCLSGVAPNIFGKPIAPEQQAAIDRYTRELTDKLERVGLDALNDLRPGSLGWSRGEARFAANRRTKGGPVDHGLPMLVASDPAGKPRAIVVGYACHCTTLNPKDNAISGDWAGDAQEAIEAAHPGATAMVVIGCGGDANPVDRPGREVASRHGREIADEVNRLLARPLRPLRSAPVGRLERIDLPFDTLPTREDLERLIQAGGPAGYNARTQLDRLDRGEALPGALGYVLQSWRFGDDLVMVFLAGEVVVDYALRLQAEFDPERLWVVAYANDVPCYIPSERILREGGYEGGGAMAFYARPTRLRPGVEDRIDSAVRAIVPASFLRKDDGRNAK